MNEWTNRVWVPLNSSKFESTQTQGTSDYGDAWMHWVYMALSMTNRWQVQVQRDLLKSNGPQCSHDMSPCGCIAVRPLRLKSSPNVDQNKPMVMTPMGVKTQTPANNILFILYWRIWTHGVHPPAFFWWVGSDLARCMHARQGWGSNEE
jgi:hypothetical protein